MKRTQSVPTGTTALPTRGGMTASSADICAQTGAVSEAIRLTQLGARAGLVARLTGLEKAAARRLYRQIHGRPSPQGLLPFTDTWYLKREQRLLQTSVVWHLSQRLARADVSAAGSLLEVYAAYRWLIPQPLLDITRVAFVPQLVSVLGWQEQICRVCAAAYLMPAGSPGSLCFGCRRFGQKRRRASLSDGERLAGRPQDCRAPPGHG